MTAQQLEQKSHETKKVVGDFIASLKNSTNPTHAAKLLRDLAFEIDVATQEIAGDQQ